MPGFPLNSLRSFVQADILSVNVFSVKVYCLLYAFVDVFHLQRVLSVRDSATK